MPFMQPELPAPVSLELAVRQMFIEVLKGNQAIVRFAQQPVGCKPLRRAYLPDYAYVGEGFLSDQLVDYEAQIAQLENRKRWFVETSGEAVLEGWVGWGDAYRYRIDFYGKDIIKATSYMDLPVAVSRWEFWTSNGTLGVRRDCEVYGAPGAYRALSLGSEKTGGGKTEEEAVADLRLQIGHPDKAIRERYNGQQRCCA